VVLHKSHLAINVRGRSRTIIYRRGSGEHVLQRALVCFYITVME